MISNHALVPGSQESLIHKAKKLPPLMMGPYNFNFDPTADELEGFYTEKARIDLREIPENKEKALEELRELLKGEPNLSLPLDDNYLYRFLRPCKWYPPSSFELIKRFFKFRQNYPQYHENLLPVNDHGPFAAGILTPMPVRTADGCRILVIQSGNRWNPKKVSLTQIFRGVIMTLEAAIAEPITQIAGVHVIFDMEGLALYQVTYFTPSFASAALEWVQRCLPCRIMGMHIINQPYIFNMVFAIFKPFINEKLRKRIHFHGKNKESLHNFVDPQALATMYGGKLEFETDKASESFWEYICKYNEDYVNTSKYGYPPKS